MNIAVIKLGALGDMVQAYAFFHALRAKYKSSCITLLTTPVFQDWAQSWHIFDDVWTVDRPKWYKIFSWLSINQKLRKFDLVIDLQNVDRTRIYRLGSQWIAPNNNHDQHPYIRFQELAHKMGLGGLRDLTLPCAHAAVSVPEKPFVLLVPGASSPQKCWPQEGFEELARRLIQAGIQPIVIGKDQYSPFLESLKWTTSFEDIIALGSQAVLSIGNDTGPQLLAYGGGAPTLTFYGPSNPSTRGGPWKGLTFDIKTSLNEVWNKINLTHN